uniref:Uncharacterized protein n=1 Tax=Ditylenchus dipsaci TaxID=166011 RepID=A0A915EDS6_9BILA
MGGYHHFWPKNSISICHTDPFPLPTRKLESSKTFFTSTLPQTFEKTARRSSVGIPAIEEVDVSERGKAPHLLSQADTISVTTGLSINKGQVATLGEVKEKKLGGIFVKNGLVQRADMNSKMFLEKGFANSQMQNSVFFVQISVNCVFSAAVFIIFVQFVIS